jgi:hypothetical protein
LAASAFLRSELNVGRFGVGVYMTSVVSLVAGMGVTGVIDVRKRRSHSASPVRCAIDTHERRSYVARFDTNELSFCEIVGGNQTSGDGEYGKRNFFHHALLVRQHPINVVGLAQGCT